MEGAKPTLRKRWLAHGDCVEAEVGQLAGERESEHRKHYNASGGAAQLVPWNRGTGSQRAGELWTEGQPGSRELRGVASSQLRRVAAHSGT